MQMPLGLRRALIRFTMFGILGNAFEVWGTGLGRLSWDNFVMRGHSSPWMFPIYGLLGFLVAPISEPLKRWGAPYLARAAVYMLGIFLVEYLSGLLLLLVGLNKLHGNMYEAVWDYSGTPWNLHGQIKAQFIPVWYGVGLVVEPVYRWVDAGATAIALKLRPDTMSQR